MILMIPLQLLRKGDTFAKAKETQGIMTTVLGVECDEVCPIHAIGPG